MELRTQIKILSLGLLLTTILVDPINLYDPINIPKLIALIALGFFSIPFIIFKISQAEKNFYVPVLALSFLFLLWLSVATLSSSLNLVDSIFGISARHTGFLTYFALVLVMVYSSILSGEDLNIKLLKILLLSGYISALYGCLQIFELDPFEWINPYSRVFGLFGNPNFHASFMALSITGAFGIILANFGSRTLLIFSWIYLPLAISNIYFSKSLQGFIGLSIGLFALIYFKIRQSKFKKLGFYILIPFILGIALALLDIFQKSPWESKLYKPSVSFRGDFWRAAISMINQSPILGTGMDSYRDNYRAHRDLIATERNYNVMVDSAHNVLLDIGVGGGIPLLLLYLLIQFYVFACIIKIIMRKSNDMAANGIIACWIVYHLQSFISINQIGVAIWGWALSGALIGYEIATRKQKISVNSSPKTVDTNLRIFFPALLAILGGIAVLPVYVTDANFRSSFASGDVSRIVQAVNKWPQSVTKMNITTSVLRQNGFESEALMIARAATKINDSNFEAWKELSMFPSLSLSEKEDIERKLKILDPLNPTLP
jgi:O-antigen ligase